MFMRISCGRAFKLAIIREKSKKEHFTALINSVFDTLWWLSNGDNSNRFDMLWVFGLNAIKVRVLLSIYKKIPLTRSVLVWLIRLLIIGWMVPSVTVSSKFFMRFRYVNDDTGANSPCSSDLSRLCSKFNRSNLWSPSNASGAIVCENNWIILIWHLFEAMQTCTQNLIYAHYLLFVLYIHIQFAVQSMIIGWWKIIERIEFEECPCRRFLI